MHLIRFNTVIWYTIFVGMPKFEFTNYSVYEHVFQDKKKTMQFHVALYCLQMVNLSYVSRKDFAILNTYLNRGHSHL